MPGIIFAHGPLGRRARLAGTGLDVFEIIKEYLTDGKDRGPLAQDFAWAAPTQLDAALA